MGTLEYEALARFSIFTYEHLIKATDGPSRYCILDFELDYIGDSRNIVVVVLICLWHLPLDSFTVIP